MYNGNYVISGSNAEQKITGQRVKHVGKEEELCVYCTSVCMCVDEFIQFSQMLLFTSQTMITQSLLMFVDEIVIYYKYNISDFVGI